MTAQIFDDNEKAWSGDHCIDPRLVPGVLFSNHKIADEKVAIVDVAPTIPEAVWIGRAGSLSTGKAWTMAGGIPIACSPVAAVFTA